MTAGRPAGPADGHAAGHPAGGRPAGPAAPGPDPAAYNARPYAGGDPYADYRPADPAAAPFTALTDLASRRLGGSVTAASDEFFAERENLLLPGPARFDPEAFGPKGKTMDGWETRRRRGAGPGTPLPAPDAHDWALIRLGAPGTVHGIVVDTAHFRGNHPAEVGVEAAHAPGAPDAAEPGGPAAPWHEIVPRTPVHGHAANAFPVDPGRRWTHLRLRQYPDGGVARLRVHGEAVPDPRWLAALGSFDLAALEHGGAVEDASDRFYSPPENLIAPGPSRAMHEGWENRRRRGAGHDWVSVRLAAHAVVRAVEIDTSHYRGNAPGWAALLGRDDTAGTGWFPLLPAAALLPDTVHRHPVASPRPVTHLRLDVLPDGGVARLRAYGTPTPRGRADLERAWERTTGTDPR